MNSKQKKWCRVWGIVNGVLVVLLAICMGVMCWISGRLPSIRTADVWRGENEMRFTQIACFLPVTEPKTEEEIWQFRRTLEEKLTEASLTAPSQGALYQDAWSAPGKVQISTEHGSTDAGALGVGGNFFLFHPMQLRSGSYLQEQDLMQDRVVLDEELAWILFGSRDVAGLEVTINGAPFYVAGVIHREDDFASQAAYRDGPGLFMAYSTMQKLCEQGITSYEIVLPDMVSGFGKNMVEDNFNVGTGAVVENSGRYSVRNLLKVAGSYGRRSMGHSGVAYPYWENAVRMTEDYLAALLVLTLVLGVVPAASLLLLIFFVLTRAFGTAKRKIPELADGLIEKHREEQYEKEQNKASKEEF